MNANTQYYDSVVNRAAMVRLFERRAYDQIELILDGHVVRLDDLLKKGNLADRRHLLSEVEKELKKTFREAYQASKKSLMDLARDQLSYTYQRVEATVGKIFNPVRPAKAVAEEFVLTRPLHMDNTLHAGWAGISHGERKRIEEVIRAGIAEKKTVDQIALDVRRGNVHSISRQHSKTLVTTAITSVTTQMDHAVYSANADVIEGWQYVSVLDSKTTPICVHRDGKIFDVSEVDKLPPSHYGCRSTTTPVFKSWDALAKHEGLSRIRKENLSQLSSKELAFYDGQTPMRESYDQWLRRQPLEVQYKHLGDYKKVELYQSGKLKVDAFTALDGKSVGINELRAMSDSGYVLPGMSRRFAVAKEKLDSMQLWARSPDDFIRNPELKKTLRDYYLLQASELDGTLSLTNYRGIQLGSKQAVKRRVLSSPPTEEQMVFNPFTQRYQDIRLYQPQPAVLQNNLRKVLEAPELLKRDKEFIISFIESLRDNMSMNERAVIADNLRIIFGRARSSGEPWVNFKAVTQGQIKFDVTNVSDAIETHLRRDIDFLKKLTQEQFIDPVLGSVQIEKLQKDFRKNIFAKNRWEDVTAPKIAEEMYLAFNADLLAKHPIIWNRVSPPELKKFYHKLSLFLAEGTMPDFDEMALGLGQKLYKAANLNGSKDSWMKLGIDILTGPRVKQYFEVETFGVQKRRMRSKLSGSFFGPYYDTIAYNLRIMDPRLQEYARIRRSIDVGMRLPVVSEENRLIVRPGYKTYFLKTNTGMEDTRIPIISKQEFRTLPDDFVDKDFASALNWASNSKYKIDKDFYDFIREMLYFQDDRGKAKHYNERNELRKYFTSRGDTYERFKIMEYLRKKDAAFSNHVFIDHRARVYERGFIGPQSGETFRPFLNTSHERVLGVQGYYNFMDQIGSFLGGLDDYFEGRHNSLTMPGRQAIAAKFRPDLVRIGNAMRRRRPADLRMLLDDPLIARIDGEELNKFFRLAIEMAKIDDFLKPAGFKGNPYVASNLRKMDTYKTALALEQDASSSGAQVIALTTRNKQVAELSNVVPTQAKQRLYDIVARDTFNDSRFREINQRLGLTEKDLRKAAKAKAMVSFYGAGERTGIMNIEGKLAKVLGKQEGTLVIKASERDAVLSEISARMARYEKLDPETYQELKRLRNKVRDVFNAGMHVGDDLMEALWFLDSKTKDVVSKMTQTYSKVVTPNDFKMIGKIMSEHMLEQVPILGDFTRFFGKLAETFLLNAKPKEASIAWKTLFTQTIRGSEKRGYTLPPRVSRLLGLKAGEAVSEKLLKRFSFWNPGSNLHQMLYGVPDPKDRQLGRKIYSLDYVKISPKIRRGRISLLEEESLIKLKFLKPLKLPKRWTTVPSVNFDGKTLHQNYTMKYETRVTRTLPEGNTVTNIVHTKEMMELSWWDEVLSRAGKNIDVADISSARTAFGVNLNHSNDAVLVKQFHIWGMKNNIPTSTVHDAFFTNAGDMLKAREALREIYANALSKNVIKMTLDEMLARGLPRHLYEQFLEEAIAKGLIPVPGKSVVGGKVLKASDILLREDILREVPNDFFNRFGFYGIG